MIPITRAGEPSTLIKNKSTWLAELLGAIVIFNSAPDETARKEINKKQGKYRNKEIKTTLSVMQDGKCAYCESKIKHVSYGCIEHFRPKSKFPNLCFDWNNLFLACDICNNREHKSDKFPLPPEGGPYVNPATENPTQFFDFVYDPATTITAVIPRDGNTRASLTVTDFGLNRRDLQECRNTLIKLIAFIAVKAKENDEKALELMHEAVQSSSEYAAFARALAQRFELSVTFE